MIPFGVDKTKVPRPFLTGWISLKPRYSRRLGFEIIFISWIFGSLPTYSRFISKAGKAPFVFLATDLINPCLAKDSKIENFKREKGILIVSLRDSEAFRIIVSMFEIGSIKLPRWFTNARNHTLTGKFTETNPAKAEVAHVTSATAAAKTAVLCPGAKLWLLKRFGDGWSFGHIVWRHI